MYVSSPLSLFLLILNISNGTIPIHLLRFEEAKDLLLDAYNASLSSIRSQDFDYGAWDSIKKSNTMDACAYLPPLAANDGSWRYTDGQNTINIDTSIFSKLPKRCFLNFVENLALKKHVSRLESVSKPSFLNFEARGITQSGFPFVEPFTTAGLDGSGQIVGVSDTGLNDLHCFFYDDSGGRIVTNRTQLTTLPPTR